MHGAGVVVEQVGHVQDAGTYHIHTIQSRSIVDGKDRVEGFAAECCGRQNVVEVDQGAGGNACFDVDGFCANFLDIGLGFVARLDTERDCDQQYEHGPDAADGKDVFHAHENFMSEIIRCKVAPKMKHITTFCT